MGEGVTKSESNCQPFAANGAGQEHQLARCSCSLNRNEISPHGMFKYYVERILSELKGRPEVSRLDIARREYALLPLFQYDKQTLTIHQMMADDAGFYFSI